MDCLLVILPFDHYARDGAQVVVAHVLERHLLVLREHLAGEAAQQLLDQLRRIHLLLRRARALGFNKLQLQCQHAQLKLAARGLEGHQAHGVASRDTRALRRGAAQQPEH